MSEENVDIVRRYFEGWARTLERYWDTPGSMAAAAAAGEIVPEAEEPLRLLDADEFEWNPVFSTEPFKGLRECAAAWDDWLEAAGDYSLALREVTDLGGDRVLAVIEGALKGKSTGIPVNAPVYTVSTLRNGLIVRIDEYTQRGEALEAAASG